MRTRKVKTDRRDARALAEACLLGAYRPAPRLSDPQRHVRGRLTVPDAVVRTRSRYIALFRALLRQQGYRVPAGSAEGVLHRVRAMTLPGRLVSTIAPLRAVMRHLNAQLAWADETIARLTAHDARVQRLRTVPSVGPVTAAAFGATLDDARRFRHAPRLGHWISAHECRGVSQGRRVGECESFLGRPRGPSNRWRPHPSTPLVRRRALTRSPRMSANRRMTTPRETRGDACAKTSDKTTAWRDRRS